MPKASITCWLFLLLLGCAEGSSIYHDRRVSAAGDRVITMDAKQRNVLVTRDRLGDWRICAEAAPDVFSALSASASLDANIATKSGRAAAALAEAAGTIERTQTVNMLREAMYRTCERYLNGMIGRSELVVQAARDQRMMIKVLAIEQLTRVARSPSTVLLPPSTAATNVDGDTAAALIKGVADERKSAESALDTATAAYDAARAKGKCDTVSAAPADDSGDPKLSDWTSCKAASATQAARQGDYDAATARFDKALAAGGQVASQSNASTGTGTSLAGGNTTSDAAVSSVATAVANIVLAPDIDEALMFCIAYLDVGDRPSGQPSAKDPQTIASCRDIVTTRAARDEQLRGTFLDAAGLPVSILNGRSIRTISPVAILNRYVTNPKGKSETAVTERQRRIKLAQAAAVTLGLPSTPPDIAGYATDGDPVAVEKILEELRRTEANAGAKADLQD
ncbi:hypothetical protein QE385_003941 [Sphingomonas sp. SORGH_AS 950]|uniref:hypothetical protein n=1 Tax=Sphingomonas sp. SORGH_AS_0950 TaxID=3041792 RepID=UPI0027896AFE|nr:hypothetical protein [Sphingomonas sp. SORGH_AS_0950]MDQ1159544.1 hypothetical protein [Sphingomonas sp. SORGH_AS_0950]